MTSLADDVRLDHIADVLRAKAALTDRRKTPRGPAEALLNDHFNELREAQYERDEAARKAKP